MNTKSIAFAVLFILGAAACQEDENAPQSQEFNDKIEQKLIMAEPINMAGSNARIAGGVENWMTSLNESLAEQNLQLEKIEFIGAEQAGNTIFFKDGGNKRLSSDYVPNDPRNGNGTTVPYLIDGTEAGTTSGMSDLETINATVNTMNTWESVTCSSGLELPFLGVAPFDIGFVQFLLGFGGLEGYFPGMITHAGVLPGAFFDAFEPGGGSFILGVTFTFVWLDDLDQDGRGDVAIKEIYMNDNFNWQDAPDDVLFNNIYDFETVLLHEVGHGLSQAHFGKAFATINGKLHFAPAALMNAGYSVSRRGITQSDEAGYCSNWGNWPNN